MFLRQTSCVPGTTCSEMPLEKRKVVKKVLAGSIAYLFLLVFFGAFALALKALIKDGAAEFNAVAGIFLFVAVFAVIATAYSIIREVFYFRNYFYDLKDDEVIIRKGFISRVELSLAYGKIQNIYVDQDVLDRLFGLYDVHLETAGFSSGIAAHIDGVSAENAAKLRGMLMEKSKAMGAPAHSAV